MRGFWGSERPRQYAYKASVRGPVKALSGETRALRPVAADVPDSGRLQHLYAEVSGPLQ